MSWCSCPFFFEETTTLRQVILKLMLATLVVMLIIIMCRIREAQKSQKAVVDVDGSYLYRKHQLLLSKGKSVAPLSLPGIPLSGWELVDKGNYTRMAKKIPCVTPGMLHSECHMYG